MSADHDDASVGAGPSTGVDRPRKEHASPDPARWIEDHGDVLFRFAMLRLGDVNDAEEAVQECLLSALGGVDSFAGRATERTWLISILKHKIVDAIRRAARERKSKDDQSAPEPGFFDERGFWRITPKRWYEDPSVAIQQKEFGPVLLDCLGKLPAGMSDAMVLRELNQLPSEEVCAALAISPQTLWQRMHRARLSLRRCLELHWFATPGRNRKVR